MGSLLDSDHSNSGHRKRPRVYNVSVRATASTPPEYALGAALEVRPVTRASLDKRTLAERYRRRPLEPGRNLMLDRAFIRNVGYDHDGAAHVVRWWNDPQEGLEAA